MKAWQIQQPILLTMGKLSKRRLIQLVRLWPRRGKWMRLAALNFRESSICSSRRELGQRLRISAVALTLNASIWHWLGPLMERLAEARTSSKLMIQKTSSPSEPLKSRRLYKKSGSHRRPSIAGSQTYLAWQRESRKIRKSYTCTPGRRISTSLRSTWRRSRLLRGTNTSQSRISFFSSRAACTTLHQTIFTTVTWHTRSTNK